MGELRCAVGVGVFYGEGGGGHSTFHGGNYAVVAVGK